MKHDLSDEEFWRWCQQLKPCRYCNTRFVGPCCPRCELSFGRKKL